MIPATLLLVSIGSVSAGFSARGAETEEVPLRHRLMVSPIEFDATTMGSTMEEVLGGKLEDFDSSDGDDETADDGIPAPPPAHEPATKRNLHVEFAPPPVDDGEPGDDDENLEVFRLEPSKPLSHTELRRIAHEDRKALKQERRRDKHDMAHVRHSAEHMAASKHREDGDAHDDEQNTLENMEFGREPDTLENTESGREPDTLKGDESEAGGDRRRRAVVPGLLKWPDHKLTYCFDNGFPQSRRNLVHQAVLLIQRNSCIRFAYSCIAIPRMNIFWDKKITSSTMGNPVFVGKMTIADWAQRGSVVHEFLHALGIYHEMGRYDRNNYLNVVNNNSGQYHHYTTPHWVDRIFMYDYLSLMHYPAFREEYGDNWATKYRQFENYIGQRHHMSTIDIMELNVYYGCKTLDGLLDSVETVVKPGGNNYADTIGRYWRLRMYTKNGQHIWYNVLKRRVALYYGGYWIIKDAKDFHSLANKPGGFLHGLKYSKWRHEGAVDLSGSQWDDFEVINRSVRGYKVHRQRYCHSYNYRGNMRHAYNLADAVVMCNVDRKCKGVAKWCADWRDCQWWNLCGAEGWGVGYYSCKSGCDTWEKLSTGLDGMSY